MLIVLDCVRDDLFRAAVSSSSSWRFLREFDEESVQFENVVAPGSWTIPSHASLFTGLYPWDHRATYQTGLVLPPSIPTIAGHLGHFGYATAAFSGNGLVQPGTGLTRGFGHSLWGGDREFFLRFFRQDVPSCRPLSMQGTRWFDSGRSTHAGAIVGALGNIASRSLPTWDAINRVGTRIAGQPAKDLRYVARWIEPELDRWLATVPGSRPVFAFVNLIEAHEPYLLNGGARVTLPDWLRTMPLLNAQERWLAGRGAPSESYLREFKRGYLGALDALGERTRTIVQTLRVRERWNNTLFIVTSDHGQSFWESGILGHRMLVTEAVTRVPLWMRPPSGFSNARKQPEWVSLVDVPATIASLVSQQPFGDPQAVNLLSPDSTMVKRTVYSTGDGLAAHEARGMKAEKRMTLDRTRVAAYEGSVKIIVEPDQPAVVETPIGSNPRLFGSEDQEDPVLRRVEADATTRLKLIQHASLAATSHELGHRLAGWGY